MITTLPLDDVLKFSAADSSDCRWILENHNADDDRHAADMHCPDWTGWLLDGKREDWFYPELVTQAKTYGLESFSDMITIFEEKHPVLGTVMPVVTDGHHRIAVAIDLRLETIPVDYIPYMPSHTGVGRILTTHFL